MPIHLVNLLHLDLTCGLDVLHSADRAPLTEQPPNRSRLTLIILSSSMLPVKDVPQNIIHIYVSITLWCQCTSYILCQKAANFFHLWNMNFFRHRFTNNDLIQTITLPLNANIHSSYCRACNSWIYLEYVGCNSKIKKKWMRM